MHFDMKESSALSMHIYVKNNPANIHADSIWNDGA